MNLNSKAFISYWTIHLVSLHFLGRLEVCNAIMNQVQDKNPKNFYGWTPLHLAALSGHSSVCEAIMKNIFDKNPSDNDGYTPLHSAAANGQIETFNAIAQMANVTDLNLADEEGWTPLHFAAKEGQIQMVKAILGQVAEKNPVNNEVMTPKDLFLEGNHVNDIDWEYKWKLLHLELTKICSLTLVLCHFKNSNQYFHYFQPYVCSNTFDSKKLEVCIFISNQNSRGISKK